MLPEALLTLDDIKRMVSTADNLRDKALVLCHYESGCRIGETLSLRVKNVVFDQYGAVLRVSGKTGTRRVRIIGATPSLSAWINTHPQKMDGDASLWVGVGTVGKNEPLSYDSTRAIFRRLAKGAGLNKRVYSHLLRHSRATELAGLLTEAQMKELLGWVQGSDMPATYVHLSGRDVDSALLRAQGIVLGADEKQKSLLMITTCPRCKQKVGEESEFCPNCGAVLDIKVAQRLEVDDEKEKAKLQDRLNVVEKQIDLLLGALGLNTQPPEEANLVYQRSDGSTFTAPSVDRLIALLEAKRRIDKTQKPIAILAK